MEGPARVEGPVAEQGDLTLSGRYVAGHDIVFAAPAEPDPAPEFVIVDRDYLEEQARKAKRIFVARSPDWADVVHGADPELRFVERDQTADLYAAVRDELLEPCRRGTDSRLQSLFVLGAPGAGKTTLVRRVAAMLVMAGECVVADFGVHTERVSAADTTGYLSALDRLAQHGTPVLVLLDDPFYANSGWVDLLHALSRPTHRGIAVLGASPDFLFERFAHALSGRRVVGRTVAVSRPSAAERRTLALLHDRDPAGSLTADEDLLVVAMEAAAGESFRDIIRRIWMTLNGGDPVDSTIDHRKLPWPVVAFAVACYFHRNYVLCPEPLLREFLLHTLIETPPSYLAQELQQLVTREGWHIFSAQSATLGQADSVSLIGSTHARVAREAWKHSPLRGLDIEKGVVDVSVRAPRAAPQLAELILSLQSSNRPNERTLANRFAVRWGHSVERRTVETRAVCALVRELRPSRVARSRFAPVLRRCLNIADSQSWLAAWQLYHMTYAAEHPQARDFLLKVDLPYTLKIADLSAGPREAVEIATRLRGDARKTVIERLIASLRGELDWRVDAEHVVWLVRAIPLTRVVPLLDDIYRWLEEGLLAEPEAGRTPDARAVEALVGLLDAAALAGEEKARLVDTVFDWLLISPTTDPGPLRRILTSADSAARVRDPLAATLLARALDLLGQRPELGDALIWGTLLTFPELSPDLAAHTERIVDDAFGWLHGGPESNEPVWSALLMLLGRSPELVAHAERILPATYERLRHRPESNEPVWSALLVLLGRSPNLIAYAEQIVPDIHEWLRGRPESNEAIWNALLTLLSRSPNLITYAEQIVPDTYEWLNGRPESNEAIWSALLTLLSRSPNLITYAEQIVPDTYQRLRGRPESNESIWSALLSLLGRSPNLIAYAEQIVPDTYEWLRHRPESNESTWNSLLSLLSRSPNLIAYAERILPDTFEWLRNRPESNESIWSALLAMLWRSPGLAAYAEQILPDIVRWLRDRPESNEGAWSALLALLSRTPNLSGYADQIVTDTYEWLRSRPESNESAWRTLLVLLSRSPNLAHHAERILPETLDWLRRRPENNESMWSTLLAVVVTSPGMSALARDLVLATFEWLRDRPGVNRGPWLSLIVALAAPLGIGARQRGDMLDALRRWGSRYLHAGSPQARGIHLLVTAHARADDLAGLVERELLYVEGTAAPALSLVYPLTYTIRQLGRADLVARLDAWARRYQEDHEAESTIYLSYIALVPQALGQPG